MKIAVTAKSNTLDSEVDSRFGRAGYFLLYDTASGGLTAVDNSVNYNASQGAGVQSAGRITGLDAGVLITGHCGPKAYSVLARSGIRIFLCSAPVSVREAITLFENDKLKEASTSDVEGHW